jgi:hypothetical protein
MARILPLVGVLEITPFYQRAWLFEPFFFLRRGTADVTTTGMVITPAPRRCQAGMEGALALVGKKVLALNGLTPDQQDICSATLSLERIREVVSPRLIHRPVASWSGNTRERDPAVG